MTVLELMERSGSDNTNLTIAWIKDAVNLIQSNTKHDLKTRFGGMPTLKKTWFRKHGLQNGVF